MTPSQVFEFTNTSAAQLEHVLSTNPLIGSPSAIFGSHPEATAPDGMRTIKNFCPAADFRFDINVTRPEGSIKMRGGADCEFAFMVEFTQPWNTDPYIDGSD